MKHLRLFENTEKANNQVVDLPVVALVQGVENGLVMSPKTDEASAATISVSESGEVSIAVNINEEDLTKGEFIDLGLPSGLKWASCNLGATKPCECGDYYMWASTTPDTEKTCDWANAPFNNGASEFDETYFNEHRSEWLDDNYDLEGFIVNTTLKPEYDAAQVAGIGRMPTDEQIFELLDNTTYEWCNCSFIDGHETHTIMGGKFTASNGNSIFIPVSGSRSGSSFSEQGVYAFVWSSALGEGSAEPSWGLGVNSSESGIYSGLHCDGFPIRPVSE